MQYIFWVLTCIQSLIRCWILVFSFRFCQALHYCFYYPELLKQFWFPLLCRALTVSVFKILEFSFNHCSFYISWVFFHICLKKFPPLILIAFQYRLMPLFILLLLNYVIFSLSSINVMFSLLFSFIISFILSPPSLFLFLLPLLLTFYFLLSLSLLLTLFLC